MTQLTQPICTCSGKQLVAFGHSASCPLSDKSASIKTPEVQKPVVLPSDEEYYQISENGEVKCRELCYTQGKCPHCGHWNDCGLEEAEAPPPPASAVAVHKASLNEYIGKDYLLSCTECSEAIWFVKHGVTEFR